MKTLNFNNQIQVAFTTILKKYISLSLIYIILNGFSPSVSNAQDFENGDFQYSSTCDVGSGCDEDISCVDGWWYFDPYENGYTDFAWIRWLSSCFVAEDPVGSCSTNGTSERGLWMQNVALGSQPNNPRRYATNNPYYGHKGNGLYKLDFTFLPISDGGNMYVQVSGASTMTQGSATFLGTHELSIPGWDNEYECYERSIYINAECSINNPSLEDYQYLVFSLVTGLVPSPPSPSTKVFGIIDNISICKIFELELQDDCNNPCLELTYYEDCASQNCINEECGTEILLSFYDGETHLDGDEIYFPYEATWANHFDCFEIPEDASEVRVSFQTYFEETSSFQTICFSHDFFQCEDYDVEANTTWGGNSLPGIDHFNTLTIKSGYTLTVDSDIVLRFCETGVLIIEPNAKLELYGTLTSNCGMGWRGVEVYGNGNASQYHNNGVYNHGRINCHPDSKIENALVAVKLYGPYRLDGGGRIFADGASFINNRSGIEFGPYTNFFPYDGKERNYASSISNCTFDITNEYSLEKNFSQHIYLENVNGLSFNGNSFSYSRTNAVVDDALDFGVGIWAHDAGFNVGPSALDPEDEPCLPPCETFNSSEFFGLGYGIFSGNERINYPFQVYASDFSNCYFGIVNYKVSGSTILFNNFEMGEVQLGPEMIDQIGIALMGPMNEFIIEENNFIDIGGNTENTIGICAENTGEVNKAIRKNTFENLTMGNQAFGINANDPSDLPIRGLHYLCNENSENTDFDFTVPISGMYSDDFIRRDQMEYVDEGVLRSAGNIFSEEGEIEDDNHFNNQSIEEINYLYDITEINQTPMDYTEETIIIDDGPENTCPSTYCLRPCLNYSKFQDAVSSYYSNLADLDDAIDNEEYRAASYYRFIHDSLVNNIIAYIRYDTTDFNRDSLRAWYLRANSIAGDYLLAGDYLGTGEYTEALSTLDDIDSRHILTQEQSLDLERVEYIYTILSSRPYDSLTTQDIDTLRLFSTDIGASSSIARTILMRGDTIYTPRYYIPGEINPRSSFRSNHTSIPVFSIYPNPTNGNVTIDITRAYTPTPQIQFFNPDGRLLKTFNLQVGKNNINLLDDVGTGSGLIFYNIIVSDQIIDHNKLVILH